MNEYNIRCRLGNQLFQFAKIYTDVCRSENKAYAVNVCPVDINRLEYKPIIKEGGVFTDWYESEQFFDPEIIRPIYRPSEAQAAAIRDKYGDLSNSLFIHVRRGDFYYFRYLFVILNGKFYEDMYEKLASEHHFDKVIIASDNFVWAKENIHLPCDVTWLEDEGPMDTIMVASQCKDFIISASTFSWWCAWLGEENGGRVICPAKKFRYGQLADEDDMFIPDRWEKVEAEQYCESAPYRVLLCAIAKMENPYLREWVEHHKRLGFDNIVLFDNNDVDGECFDEVIGDYIQNGYVIVEDVRGKSEQQSPCYMKCYYDYGKYYDWIAFFDIDEFMQFDDPKMEIHEYLKHMRFMDYNCVRLCWKNYTDSGLTRVKDGNYSVTRFTEWVPSRCCKSIIRTGLQLQVIKAHGGTPVKPCDAAGKPCWNDEKPSFAKIGTKPRYKRAWLNHYRCKTIEEYMRFKMFRLYPDQPQEKAKKELTFDFFCVDNKWTKEKKQVAKEIFEELGMAEKGYQLYW